jgi:membrane protein DedA with SNARE-associated domain
MNGIFRFLLRHGYSMLFAALFAHQVGLPIPGPLLLVSAGALVAAGKMGAFAVLGITVLACVSADWIWYEAGRRGGDKVLHFMHRFTHDPDFHDRRAKRVFARYGPPLLLVAKFVPGLDAVAPPLAGTSLTSRARFLALDSAAASLYACVYGGLGFAFSHDLDRAANYIAGTGRLFLGLALTGISFYVVYNIYRHCRRPPESQLRIVPAAFPAEYGEPAEIPCDIFLGEDHGD